uniref:Uncharacterized protein n=1 Tax=Arundo donax TaxID=35708 RepID=A0A0A9D746_ARUDO
MTRSGTRSSGIWVCSPQGSSLNVIEASRNLTWCWGLRMRLHSRCSAELAAATATAPTAGVLAAALPCTATATATQKAEANTAITANYGAVVNDDR